MYLLECLLYIKKALSLDLKDVVPKSFWGIAPISGFSFITVKRYYNKDHWTSEVTIPVNIPFYFLRLLFCRTLFKGRCPGRTFRESGDVTP